MFHNIANGDGSPIAEATAPGSSLFKTPYGVPGWKRWTDRILAGLLLFICSPIILAAFVIVKLTSRGPGFYSQQRLGHNQLKFTLYKIRTMEHNCEAQTGPQWATQNDPRVTFVGKIFRSTHIDELPQLWNVLRGEMALVGPRPERPEIVKVLVSQISNYMSRLTVLPGITGLAQIQLPPDTNTENVRRKLQYDVYYVNHFGPWLDARLIITTVFKIVGLQAVMRHLLRIPGPNEVESSDWSLGFSSEATGLNFGIHLPRVGPSLPEFSGA